MVPPEHAPRHIAVGNLNLDISIVLDNYPEEDSHVFAKQAWMGLGGAATNYAVAVARLGHNVSLIARTGGDALRLGLLDRLEAYGVSSRMIEVVPTEPMGMVVVVLVPSRGSRTMLSIRGANEGLSPKNVLYDSEATVYHFASVKPQLIAELCSKPWWRSGFTVSYDPGGEVYRYPHLVSEVLDCIDILFMNEKEISTVLKAAGLRSVEALNDASPSVIVIVKKGHGGATAYVASEPPITVQPPRIDRPVVDVTGAGDAFDAAFNVWLLEGRSIHEAVKAAVVAGALKTRRKGSSNMPSRKEVESLLSRE